MPGITYDLGVETGDFENKVVTAGERAGKAAGGKLESSMSKAARQAGKKSADAIRKEIAEIYDAKLGRLNRGFLSGAIDAKEFKRKTTVLKQQLHKAKQEALKLGQQAGWTEKELNKLAKTKGVLTGAAKRMGRATKDAGGKMRGMGGRASMLKSKLLGVVGSILGAAGLSRAFRFLAGDAAAFETAMAQVNTILPATEKEMAALSHQVRQLSKRLPKTAEDLGYGLYQVLSAGVSDAADAMYVLEQSAKLATGGLLETSDAVKTVTAIINAYNLHARDAADVTDILFRTVEKGVTTVPELAQGLGTVITTAAQVGVSFEQVGAAVAALTKAGVRTEIATTGLNALFVSLIKVGGEAQETARELGLEWSLTGVQAMGFSKWLEHVREKTGGSAETLTKLTGNVRAARAIMVLAGGGAENYADAMDSMAGRVGSADRAAEKMTDTLRGQTALLKNEFTAAWADAIGAIAEFGVRSARVLNNIVRLGVAAQGGIGQFKRVWDDLFAGDDGGDPNRWAGARAQERGIAEAIAQAGARGRLQQEKAAAAAAELAAHLKDVGGELAKLFERGVDAAKVSEWAVHLRSAAERILEARTALSAAVETGDAGEIAAATAELREAEAAAKGLAEAIQEDPAGIIEMGRELGLIRDRIEPILQDTEDLGVAWEEVAGAVAGIGKGLLNVLDAAGKLDDETRVILRGAIDIAEAWQSIQAARASAEGLTFGAAAGPVAAAVGAAVGIAMSVFGRGDDDAARDRLKQIQAMDDLRRAIEELADTIEGGLAPQERAQVAADAREALAGATHRGRSGAIVTTSRFQDLPETQRDAIQRFLEQAGLDLDDFIDESGRIQSEALSKAIDAWQRRALGLFDQSTLGGALDAMRFVLDALGEDAGNAAERMSRLVEVLRKFSPAAAEALEELDPEEQRKQLQEWARILAAGGPELESLLEQLGLSAEDLARIIQEGLGISAPGAEGVSRSAQVRRTITEIQAVEVVAWLEEIAYTLREIRALLAGEDALKALVGQASAVPGGAAMAGGATATANGAMAGAGTTNIVNIGPNNITSPYLTPEQLRQIFEEFAERVRRSGAPGARPFNPQ